MGSVLRDALRIFSRRGARFLGAAVAFYALLSAAPLFVVVLHVVGAIVGPARAEDGLWTAMGTWIGPQDLETVRELTSRLDRVQTGGGIVESALVLYGSTRLFRALHRAINVLWGVDLEEAEGARPRAHRYAVRYGRAISLTLLTSLLVVCLVVVKGAFAVLGAFGAVPPPAVLWAFDAIASIALAFALFTVLFRFLPELTVTWREAAVSGAVSAGLFAIGSLAVSLYLRHKGTVDLYAGASAVVLAVLWVYYSAQVFFLGACVGAAMRERREK